MKQIFCLSFTLIFGYLFFIPRSELLAQFELAPIFSDNMVLQRDMDLKFWGTAKPDAIVSVKFKDQFLSATSDSEGKWMVTADPIQIGDPFEIIISDSKKSITLKNVVAGEVWICSGQSNMEWPLRATKHFDSVDGNSYPLIRHIKIDRKTAFSPQKTLSTNGWEVCRSENAGNFTAVGFHFAQHLQEHHDVPIGLLNTSWGGTVVEAWTSAETLTSNSDFTAKVEAMRLEAENPELAKERAIKFENWRKNVNAAIADVSENWSGSSIDDSSWESITVPGYWENQGFKDVDGCIWYRKNVSIPKSWVGKELTFHLGKVDDGDNTYINGQLVGETNSWNAERKYSIDGSLVTSDELQVAVRVTDGNLGGGIYTEPTITLANGQGKRISLAGRWQVKPTSKTKAAGAMPPVAFAGPNQPTVLYNAMVNPLVPFSFRGVIWYQGESNAGRSYQYRELFPALIKDWRSKWNRDFPFYWVQLANFEMAADQPGPSNWAELREAQSMTLSLPGTGQAVIIDIGEANDIHPRNKRDVGKRLALIARANVYQDKVEYSGPVYKSHSIEGNTVTIEFDHAEGLMAKGGQLKRFELAGSDQEFHFADAEIIDGSVKVSCPKVPQPVAIRYAWANNPEGCNLYNGAGLPASPFRTDSWKGITAGVK